VSIQEKERKEKEMSTCENCGCKVYNGHCVNCHEETYIAEQNAGNDEQICFSQEFDEKLVEQEVRAREIRRKEQLEKERKEQLKCEGEK
jgi:hypothetical protein